MNWSDATIGRLGVLRRGAAILLVLCCSCGGGGGGAGSSTKGRNDLRRLDPEAAPTGSLDGGTWRVVDTTLLEGPIRVATPPVFDESDDNVFSVENGVGKGHGPKDWLARSSGSQAYFNGTDGAVFRWYQSFETTTPVGRAGMTIGAAFVRTGVGKGQGVVAQLLFGLRDKNGNISDANGLYRWRIVLERVP